MNTEILEDALLNASALLNSELESVIHTGLSDEYLIVIKKIENALKELKNNG